MILNEEDHRPILMKNWYCQKKVMMLGTWWRISWKKIMPNFINRLKGTGNYAHEVTGLKAVTRPNNAKQLLSKFPTMRRCLWCPRPL